MYLLKSLSSKNMLLSGSNDNIDDLAKDVRIGDIVLLC